MAVGPRQPLTAMQTPSNRGQVNLWTCGRQRGPSSLRQFRHKSNSINNYRSRSVGPVQSQVVGARHPVFLVSSARSENLTQSANLSQSATCVGRAHQFKVESNDPRIGGTAHLLDRPEPPPADEVKARGECQHHSAALQNV